MDTDKTTLLRNELGGFVFSDCGGGVGGFGGKDGSDGVDGREVAVLAHHGEDGDVLGVLIGDGGLLLGIRRIRIAAVLADAL
jgi:hypothetical protein